jgi:asparagine synthase (glutamine-hydrolysing)
VSAICGAVGLDGRPWRAADLAATMAALAPLGRDGGGAWSGTAGRCGVALGAALRHATPEDLADDQPAAGAGGELRLVFDGRVDNRDELAAALGIAGGPSIPDSRLVLAAYERWGDGFLDRLVGVFALAIADDRRGGVLLARDHAGQRPLVVHERGGLVAFASHALALAELEGVGRTLSRLHAAELLAVGYRSPRTIVEGVEWLEPGTTMWIDAGGARRRRWWRPDPDEIVDLGSPAAHERELRDVLERAVAPALRSVRGVGAMTSGGLDSTSVAATAARQLAPAPLPTYTSVPPDGWAAPERPGWDADESSLVRALAAMHPNLRPSFPVVQPGQSLFAAHEELWGLGGVPARNPANQLWQVQVAKRAQADGLGALLTGAFGNYSLSPDGPRWLAELLRAGRLSAFGHEVRAWRGATGEPTASILRRRLAGQLMPPAIARRRDAQAAARASRDWVANTALRPSAVDGLDLATVLPRRTANFRANALAAVGTGAAQASSQAALAALTGVEHRDPTSNRRLLEVATRQPEWVRRHDGITRAVVRGAMSDRLPEAIRLRTRRGEQLPHWLDVMTAAREEIARELVVMREHPLSRELIDIDRLERLSCDWPASQQRREPGIEDHYRRTLWRAATVSRYLRWFEGGG